MQCLADGFNRRIDYLRLSVTDHCNLRCAYCMPVDAVIGNRKGDILSFEEIVRMVTILAGEGIRRVRLTGGEPLVRKGLPDLVRRLNGIGGIREVLLTTNGVLLKPLARELREAGLRRINIHLDTLSYDRFRTITRWGNLADVLVGIDEARRMGFRPIKLNAVVVKGFNDGEAETLLLFAAENGLILRFIELMPIGPARGMAGSYISMDEIRSRLAEKYTLNISGGDPWSAVSASGGGPAVYYSIPELGTTVGFITPLSQPFCAACNRIRISADGRFQDCLAADGIFSFREWLRNPAVTDEAIGRKVVALLGGKRESHNGFAQGERERTPCMYGIGG